MESAAFGFSPKAALRAGLLSGWAWTALVDDQPEAMFGLVVVNAIEGRGRPWFLGTDEVDRHGRALLGLGPGLLAMMRSITPTLGNHVGRDNRSAIRLLKRWGFVVDQNETLIGGLTMRAFLGECGLLTA